MIKLTEKQIIDGQNEAYLKAGHNAYFGNGFNAGVEFALKQVNKLPIHGVSKSVFCEDCKHTVDVRLKRNPCRCVECGGKL